ncbi:hypothetical protein TRFO_34489 [Tritrichomonas foetus]|uniref:Uncharacterized protein n=1 Tax=Tritrichomonas foetus TaxID=1144522 RepID=A0A1J4JIX6_9EUKA|nr:hypothetical protein TRFO_34489 [Tritrichomonas foetus]|eukprot:OHS99136.1 hypothetical protein TRFO_34489 [Tritrichomonas foetus]
MFDSFIKNYRIATGVYLFTKPEQRVWDIIFLVLLITFTIGIISLSINTYRSFGRLLWGSGARVVKNIVDSGKSPTADN